ncbi:uncharacterized protein HMPREF1541_02484 [Cyphellophora europaea CBS 101466]|uniref:DNA polymerase eta n=1 Tax=Cyphellophora europaea (strain CBS 101466) TaxID=1220924 RepID=W2S3Z4_CYPE1|nr:uncharacterized protein HMPREF1541_02484 [Cyphellophora europaea CBS 101466]ETN43325.1 hypothetical protein HMPREF1541_02484 [Cyphellophora europaea CBS 101466]
MAGACNATGSTDLEGDDDKPRSRFTYRDLRLLSKASVESPLRVITLIDFDCFYAQCESGRLGLSPEQPLGVQQFKHVIAINYAARAAGLKKVVSADEARKKCPSIVLQHVPTWRPGDTTWRYRDDALQHMDSDKASLDYYKLQSREAMEVLKQTLPGPQRIERAGIDETYVDLSAPVYGILVQRYPELAEDGQPLDACLPPVPMSPLDWEDSAVEEGQSVDVPPPPHDWDTVCLFIGAQLVRSIRNAIFEKLQYTCSAGIARNKVLAKLGSGHNKPNKQTVILNYGISSFLASYKFTKLRGLGRKLGREVIDAFKTEQLSELALIPLSTMRAKLGSSEGTWVYNVIRGVEYSEVVSRTQLKSVLSAKTFMPPITRIQQAEPWLDIFAADIVARLEDLGGQRPRTIAVHVQVHGPRHPGRSKQGPVPTGVKVDAHTLAKLARDLLAALEREGTTWPLVTLSVDVSNLQEVEKARTSISSLLAAQGRISRNGESPPVAVAEPMWRPTATPPPPSKHRAGKRTLLDFQGFAGGATGSPFGTTKKARHDAGVPCPPPLLDGTEAEAEVDNGRRERDSAPAAAAAAVMSTANTGTSPSIGGRGRGRGSGAAAAVEAGDADDDANADEDEEEQAEQAEQAEQEGGNGGGSYLCPTCHDSVPEAAVLEHLDWHAAMELQENGLT